MSRGSPGPGDCIGDWVVEAQLGEGGMGTVFRCHNALAPRIQAAVKVLRPEAGDDNFRERFAREVEALEQLEHPAIVRVKGWGETGFGLFLAMDLVEGRDLASRLLDGPLDASTATTVFRDLAAGLAHAHERNVFHRDIKPANILLGHTPGGGPTAKLVDFGIAVQGGRTRLSAAGMVSGTPAYLAPEVFGGQPDAGQIDLYALGQVLYEALTGKPAFDTPDALTTTARIAHIAGAKMRGQALDPGTVRPDLPLHLRRLVQRATHPDPAHRLADMQMFLAGLDGEVFEVPAARTAAETLSFDLDIDPTAPAPEVASEPVPPEAPPVPVPVTTSIPVPPEHGGASPLLGLLLGGMGVLVLAGLALGAWVLTKDPAPGRVVLSGIEADAERLVRIDGRVAEPEPPDGLVYTVSFADRSPEDAIPIEVVTGPHCDLDAFAGTCGVCCACEHAEVLPGQTASIPLMPPSGERQVDVYADVPGELRQHVKVRAGDQMVPYSGGGRFSTTLPPGEHALQLTIDRADDPRRARQVIDVACAAEPLSVTLALPAIVDVPPEPLGVQTAGEPFLQGRRIRIVYRSADFEMVKQLETRLKRQGAEVDRIMSDQASRQLFGKIVFWSEADEPVAAALQEMLGDLMAAEPQPASAPSKEQLDFAIWPIGATQ